MPKRTVIGAAMQQKLTARYAEIFGIVVKHHDWISRGRYRRISASSTP